MLNVSMFMSVREEFKIKNIYKHYYVYVYIRVYCRLCIDTIYTSSYLVYES